MAGSWMDTSGSCNKECTLWRGTNEVQEGTPWGKLGEYQSSAPAVLLFRVLKPQLRGIIVSKEMEARVLVQAYKWMTLMVLVKGGRKVFEAAVLINCATTIAEENLAHSIVKIGALEKMDAFGYTVKALLCIIGRALVPSLLMRLKRLIVACIQAQERHKFSDPQERAKTFLDLKTGYDKFLRFRNINGFFEGGLITCLAAAGVLGAGLTAGAIGDIVEATILTHNLHQLVRHFAKHNISGAHCYPPSTTLENLRRAFHRISLLNRRFWDLELPRDLKRATLVYATSYHQFVYMCKRYGYGATYCEAVGLCLPLPL